MLGTVGPDCSSKTAGKSKAAKSKAANAQQQGTSARAKAKLGVQKMSKAKAAAKTPVAMQAQGPGGKASSTAPRPGALCSFMEIGKLKLMLSQWEAELRENTSVKTGPGKKSSQEVLEADAKLLSENLRKLIDAITSRQPETFEEDALLEYAREQRSLVAAFNDPFVIARYLCKYALLSLRKVRAKRC